LKRRRADSNRGIKVLQTSALPLGYAAGIQHRGHREHGEKLGVILCALCVLCVEN
jgi:hypothetical protein